MSLIIIPLFSLFVVHLLIEPLKDFLLYMNLWCKQIGEVKISRRILILDCAKCTALWTGLFYHYYIFGNTIDVTIYSGACSFIAYTAERLIKRI